jgi:hypothetical protein
MKTLEKKCEQFEIPLPDRPAKTQKAVADPDVMEDRFLYRSILTGIQSETMNYASYLWIILKKNYPCTKTILNMGKSRGGSRLFLTTMKTNLDFPILEQTLYCLPLIN